MNQPRIQITSTPSPSATLVVFRFKSDPQLPDVPVEEFSGSRNTTCLLRQGAARTLHVGLGPRERFVTDTLRQAAGVAVKGLLKLGVESVALDLRNLAPQAQAAVEGALLAAHRFEEFRQIGRASCRERV